MKIALSWIGISVEIGVFKLYLALYWRTWAIGIAGLRIDLKRRDHSWLAILGFCTSSRYTRPYRVASRYFIGPPDDFGNGPEHHNFWINWWRFYGRLVFPRVYHREGI